MSVSYADEDIGSNCGKFIALGGDRENKPINDKYGFANRLWNKFA